MKGQTYVILAFIFVIIVSVFAVTNVSVIEVNYLFWSGEAPLILVILFSVLMGGVITAISGSIKIIRLQRENKSLKAENKQMESLLNENNLLDVKDNDTSNQKETSSQKSNETGEN